MWRRRWTMVLAAVAALVTPMGASVSALPTTPQIERLDNGLTVVLMPWDSPGIVAYQTTVRVGSRDEFEPGLTGYAHLFEHMMFRGTARYPKPVYEREIQLLGADNNAFTWLDLTNYFLLVPTEGLAKVIDIEADRFQHLEYSDDDYRTETGAVLGEYHKNAANPWEAIDEALSELAFEKHTYGHTTMGYLRDVEKMPEHAAHSREFFRRYYTPDNAFVIVVGDFDAEDVLTRIRAAYGSWEGKRFQAPLEEEPVQTEPRLRHIDWSSPTTPKLAVGYKIPAFSTETADAAALQVVHELAFGESSPLYQRLVLDEKKLLALRSSGGIWGPITRDPYLFTVSAVLAPDAQFAQVQEAITAELAALARGEVDEKRLGEVRSHLRYRFSMGMETPEDVALTLAMFVASTGEIATADAFLKRLTEVDAEAVTRVAREYLRPIRRTTVTLSQGGEGGAR